MDKRDEAATKAWAKASTMVPPAGTQPMHGLVREVRPVTAETISQGVVIGFFKIVAILIAIPMLLFALLLILNYVFGDEH